MLADIANVHEPEEVNSFDTQIDTGHPIHAHRIVNYFENNFIYYETDEFLALESVEAYLEVAKFAEENEFEYRKIIIGYEEASRMLLKIDESRSIECFQKFIDIYIKNGDINKAIQRCFEYGHSIKSQSEDSQKGHDFFAQGQRLRAEHDIQHSCVITTFRKRSYYSEDYKIVKELIRKVKQSLNKFNVEETIAAFCADCIGIFYDLCEYFEQLAKDYARFF
ncbi:hypothetical protein RF11_14476 [Thelohanellus kitauei]|uniref:Uncharacterized protein n=1 Tax=Thelohanellus kitauei TaxID=669202 RepID=A0A0C2NF63_THEKT|nr:hypothetical protein RF11_14476 [Thelohanellus kitauei]